MNWPDPPSGIPLGDGRHAHAIDRPKTVDELRQVVTERVGQGHALYPQGGGTSLDYGGTPRAPGVAVDTRALDRVIDYPAADMTITVEAGITLRALEHVLDESNQRLLIDAPRPELATVGGVFATQACGPRRFGLGRPRDQVIGLSFVASDGQVVKGGGRVVKNVAGYDLPRLLTGSMGTLGILCQLTLKVRPRPETSALVWAVYDRSDRLAETLDRLNTSATRPVALELLNPSASRVNGAALGLPGGGWVLVVGFEDSAGSVDWQVDRLGRELEASTVEVLRGDAAAPLWSGLTAFQDASPGPLSFVANLRPSGVVPFLNALDPKVWSAQAHAGNGVVRAHFIAEPLLDHVERDVVGLRARAVADGGNLMLSRCPVEWKTRLKVWGEPRPDWAIAERIKAALDPLGVMNPGRFVGTI